MLPPLPPLLQPLPLLPPLPAPLGHVVVSAPGSQSWRTTEMPRVTSSGADFVQVVLKEPDDEFARVELVAAGVEFHGRSMVPKTGTLHMMRTTAGAYVYRWRV